MAVSLINAGLQDDHLYDKNIKRRMEIILDNIDCRGVPTRMDIKHPFVSPNVVELLECCFDRCSICRVPVEDEGVIRVTPHYNAYIKGVELDT